MKARQVRSSSGLPGLATASGPLTCTAAKAWESFGGKEEGGPDWRLVVRKQEGANQERGVLQDWLQGRFWL